MSDIDIIDTPLPDEIQEEEKPEEKPETEEKPEETEASEEEKPAEETAEEDPESVSEEEKPRKRRSAQKRIGELTRARHEAERRAQEAERQLEALKTRAEPETEPKQEDFQSLDDFVVALAEFRARETVRNELGAVAETVQKNQSEAEQTARAADWDVKLEDARDRYDDFDEVTQDPDLKVSEAMLVAMAEEENGADVAYHLGNNPKLSREIATLSPMKAVLRIGKLAAKLAEPPKPKTTAASPPIKTVKTSGTQPSQSPEDMNYPDYAKWRRKGGK